MLRPGTGIFDSAGSAQAQMFVLAMSEIADLIEQVLAPRLAGTTRKPLVLGIAGAQGSGKSTVAGELAHRLCDAGLRCALLSLDDLYLDGAHRAELAERIHPLLRTRGVPGTHDVTLGLQIIERLGTAEPALLPRFDKARDEPHPQAAWESFTGPADVLVFEGWCLGARPQTPTVLAEPVNALEREEDRDAIWRRYVNDQLAGDYRILFDRIDLLVLLAAPGFDVVVGWRGEQEEALRSDNVARGLPVDGLMSPMQIRRFVQHYQRLTEHMLCEGGTSADLVIRLGPDRLPATEPPGRKGEWWSRGGSNP
jgi:D-glycerate 3-kinase